MKKVLLLCGLAVIGLCNMGQKVIVDQPAEKVALDVSKATYANIGGKLCVYTGKTAIVKQYDSTQSKLVDVAVPKADTVRVEPSTDSTGVVWVKDNQYEVRTKRELKAGYNGTFDSRMGKAFWVGDIIGIDGKRRPSLAVIDYDRGTYFVPGPIKSGEAIDPGYETAPNLIGPSPKYANAVPDSTRPLPDTTGDQIKFWFTGDSVPNAPNKFLNLIGNDTGVSGDARQVTGGAIGNCVSFDGADSIVWADKDQYDISGQATIMTWAKAATGAENGYIVGKSNGVTSSTGYALFWTGSSDRLASYGCTPSYRYSSTVFVDSVWTRTTLVFADSTRYFRNGIAAGGGDASTPFIGTINLSLGTAAGASATSNAWNGWIDRTIIADTAISRIRRNTYMISKREIPTSIRDTTAGIVWIDTAGAQCDSIAVWNPTAGKSVRLKVVAGNLYDITGAFALDTTLQDTVSISVGKRRTLNIHGRATLRYAGVNDIGQGDSTEYVQDFYKAVLDTFAYYPVIDSIRPASGSAAGGETVTIYGSHFYADGDSISVGGVNVWPDSWEDTEIELTTPPHAVGEVSVIVTNSYALADTVTFTFTGGVIATDPNKGPYKQRPYRNRVYKSDPYKLPANKQGDGW